MNLELNEQQKDWLIEHFQEELERPYAKSSLAIMLQILDKLTE